MNRIFVAAVLTILGVTPAFGGGPSCRQEQDSRAQSLHRYPFARKVRGGG